MAVAFLSRVTVALRVDTAMDSCVVAIVPAFRSELPIVAMVGTVLLDMVASTVVLPARHDSIARRASKCSNHQDH
jgi:hypothetical protein